MHTPNPTDIVFNPIQYWTDVYKMQIELAEMTLAMVAVANPVLARAVIRGMPGTSDAPASPTTANKSPAKQPSTGRNRAPEHLRVAEPAKRKPSSRKTARRAKTGRPVAARPKAASAPAAETSSNASPAKAPAKAPRPQRKSQPARARQPAGVEPDLPAKPETKNQG